MKKKLLTLALVAGLVLASFSATLAANSSTNNRSSGGGSSYTSQGGSGPINSGTTSSSTSNPTSGEGTTFTNTDGKTVTKAEYSANGIDMTVATVGNDGTVVTESDAQNGAQHVMIRAAQGGPDVGANGEVICKYAILVITENGVPSGCFVNPATNTPLATGADATYWAYDANGNLQLHWVNALGFFYTGTHIINGQTVIFNNEGVIIG